VESSLFGVNFLFRSLLSLALPAFPASLFGGHVLEIWRITGVFFAGIKRTHFGLHLPGRAAARGRSLASALALSMVS
jgi:hypothetical protein